MIRIKHSGKYEGQTKSLSTTRDGHMQDTTSWTYDVSKGLVTGKIYADDTEENTVAKMRICMPMLPIRKVL